MTLSVLITKMGRTQIKKNVRPILNIRYRTNIIRRMYVRGSTLRARGRLVTGRSRDCNIN